jgi:hypothetical protein
VPLVAIERRWACTHDSSSLALAAVAVGAGGALTASLQGKGPAEKTIPITFAITSLPCADLPPGTAVAGRGRFHSSVLVRYGLLDPRATA